MAKRWGLLEKEIAASVEEKSSVPRSHSNLSQAAIMSTARPEMDELLENTFLNIQLDVSLTKRETEILKLIVAGKTNKKIAQEICRTERTVEYHRHRLMRKLGAHSAADLVKRAITMGIV
jgi:DNA-binding NarL/FixJ family response regulator